MDDENIITQKEAINRLQRTEIRFHIFKLCVIILASVLTGVFVVRYVHRDNDRTRNQINCVVNGFLQRDPQVAARIVQGCK